MKQNAAFDEAGQHQVNPYQHFNAGEKKPDGHHADGLVGRVEKGGNRVSQNEEVPQVGRQQKKKRPQYAAEKHGEHLFLRVHPSEQRRTGGDFAHRQEKNHHRALRQLFGPGLKHGQNIGKFHVFYGQNTGEGDGNEEKGEGEAGDPRQHIGPLLQQVNRHAEDAGRDDGDGRFHHVHDVDELAEIAQDEGDQEHAAEKQIQRHGPAGPFSAGCQDVGVIVAPGVEV